MKQTTTKQMRHKVLKIGALLLCFLISLGNTISAQVTVTGATTGDGSYSTLSAAFTAINPPNINTGAAINIELSGNVTETVSAVLNSSDWASVNITASVPVTVSGSITGAIIKLNGADNVTIDGSIGGSGRNITIQNNANVTATAAVWIAGTNVANAGATNNTIRNCNISCGAPQHTGTLVTFGILIGGTTISATVTTGLDNDNNSIIDNYITKARNGICTRGAGATNLNQNTIITGNLIGPASFGSDAIGVAGILLQFENNCNVSQNEVRFVGGDFANTSAGADRVGIALGVGAWTNTNASTTTNTNFVCSRNLIHDIIEERTFSALGILCATTNGGSPTNNTVCDNMIYHVKANGTSGDCVSGIGISGGHSDQIVNNSIYLYGDVDPNIAASTPSMMGWGIRISTANTASFTNLNLRNNIIYMNLSSSSAPGARFYAIGAPTAAFSFGAGGCNNNNYYIDPLNSQSRIGGFSTSSALAATTEFASLPLWQTAFTVPQDAASLSLDPGYTSLTDLHISLGNPNMNDVGAPAFCGVDFDGDTRSGTPDIGADEYSPVLCAGNDGGIVTPSTVSKCLGQTHTMSSVGYTIGAGASYQWEVSSTPGFGFTNVSGGIGATTPNYNTGVLPAGIYYFRMRTDCFYIGEPGYSNEIELTVNSLPSVSVTASLSSLCQPGASPSELTASGASTYTWSPLAGLSSTTGSIVNALPLSSATYIVTGTDANGCTGTSSTSISVFSAPILNPTTATPNSVCLGGNSQLNVDAACFSEVVKITEVTLFRTGTFPTNPYPAYIPAGDQDFVEISNIGLTPIDISGLVYEAWSGTTLSRTLTFPSGTVIPSNNVLVVSLTTGTNDPINRLYFTGTTTSGPFSSGGATGHLIKNGSSIIDAVATNTYVWPVASGVTAADWSGAGASSPSGVSGTIRTASTDNNTGADWSAASAVQPQSIGTFNSGYLAGSCTFNYSWSPSNFIAGQELLQSPLATGITSTTTYTVVVTNPLNNCTSTGSVTVSTGQLVCDAPSAPALICSNTNFTITSNTSGGGLPYSYLWDDGAMGVYPDASTITANLPAGNYTFTVTTSDACGSSCSSTISILVNETPSGTASGTTDAVIGDVLSYAVTGYTGTPNFQWQTASNLAGPWTNVGINADTYSVSATIAGTIYVQCVILSANGCAFTTEAVTTIVKVPGDNPCNAITLPLGFSGPYTSVGATADIGEPTPPLTNCNSQNSWCSGSNAASHSVWFKFVAPPSGRISLGNGAPLWDNELAIYSVTDCNDYLTYSLIAANDDSASSPFNSRITPLCLTPGQTYYVQLDGFGTGTNGAFFLNLVEENNGVAMKAFLSGAYDASLGLMHDSLRVVGVLPTTEPYTAAPYNKPVLGETAGETIDPSLLAVTGNDAIVDWVFIEVRNSTTPSTIVATKRAVIQRDGDIKAANGGDLIFTSLPAGSYNVSLKHRNHLGVMASAALTINPCSFTSLDFTTSPLWVKPGEINGPARMFGPVAALWSSDANTNKNAKYNGLSNDKQVVLNAVGVGTANNVLSPVYRTEDLNMDGKVKYNNVDNDRNVIANTVGVSTPNNIVNQHTPN